MIELPTHFSLIMFSAFVATVSPGPATIGIAMTSMSTGRVQGLIFASGIFCGSLFWSILAAFGLGTFLSTVPSFTEGLRYIGAGYLMFLAVQSARNAWRETEKKAVQKNSERRLKRLFFKGLAVHITNPKAILFFTSLYSMIITSDTHRQEIIFVMMAVALQSFLLFHAYAIIFSHQKILETYMRMRRVFEVLFALSFGAASFTILFSSL